MDCKNAQLCYHSILYNFEILTAQIQCKMRRIDNILLINALAD